MVCSFSISILFFLTPVAFSFTPSSRSFQELSQCIPLLFPFLILPAHAKLYTLAKSAELEYFGTATDNNELTDTAYQAVLAGGDFGQITPANSQKWDAIEPSNGAFTFADGYAMTALAKQNSQLETRIRTWLIEIVSGGTWTNETLLEVMKNHITTEMTHYKGQYYARDVVNEAFNDNGTLRTDVFYNTIGPQYIQIAFETASAADSNVKLYYNDYNIEYPGVKATAALELVKSLKASGTKIDGVGFQSHFIVGEIPSLEDQVSNLESFTALGFEVALTELDIRVTLPSTEALLAQQSTDYANSVGACVATKGCVGITVWDFDDKYSWIPQTFSGHGAAYLWDKNLNKKPAHYGVIAALKGNLTSNLNNQVSTTVLKSTGPITQGVPGSINNHLLCQNSVAYYVPASFQFSQQF